MPRISIIIPCYREAKRIPETLPRLAAYLDTISNRGITCEVLLIVERSPDNTLSIAREIADGRPGWHAIDNQVHKGKGYAVRTGMLRAHGDFACFMDADLSTDPTAVVNALSLLDNHPEFDIVAGDRRHPQSVITRNQGKSRITLSGIFNRSVRMLFPRSVKTRDTQCGFKFFRIAAAKELFSYARIDGFAFDVEIFTLAHHLAHPIQMMSVHWKDAPHSTVRALRHGIQMYRDLLRLRFFQ